MFKINQSKKIVNGTLHTHTYTYIRIPTHTPTYIHIFMSIA